MHFLLDDTLAPITSRIGFLETDCQRAASAFENWMGKILRSYGIGLVRKNTEGDLKKILLTLTPLVVPVPTKTLFIPAANGWTAVFNNFKAGPDVSPLVSVLSGHINCRGIYIAAIPHTMPSRILKDSRGRYGATIFEVYSQTGDYCRTIYSANDGGSWVFGQFGDPFPFEDGDAYNKKKIRDRFTMEMLEHYLRFFRVNAFDEAFYLPPNNQTAIILTRKDPPSSLREEYSLKELRDSLGLED